MGKQKSIKEVEETFRRQAKEFKALQKVLSYEGSFKNMQQATICAGLAEVAEMLADGIKRREVEA
jgi:hypothetical protein